MKRSFFQRWTFLSFTSVLAISACASTPREELPDSISNPDDLLIVDCLLPGQLRQLGTKLTYLSPRRPIKTSASRCAIRGGEFVAFDRADAGASLKIWLPQAQSGDPQAQTYVGEIFEKGLGVEPDYSTAANWYEQAAEQDYTRAQINLGYLYESGLGVVQDLTRAMNLYRQASGIDSGSLEYVSTVEFARRESAKKNTVALQTRVSDLQQRLLDSEQRFRELTQQAQADQFALNDLRERTEAKRREIAEQSKLASETTTSTSKVLAELENVRNALSSEVESNDDLNKQLAESRNEIQALKSGVLEDTQEVETLKNRLSEQFKIIAKLEAAAENPGNEPSDGTARSALAQAREAVESTRQEVDALRRQDNDSVSNSLLQDLADAEDREFVLAGALAERTQSLADLRRQQVQLEAQYREGIHTLQLELDLSQSELARVSARLVDSDLTRIDVQSENQELRDRLREQNEEVDQRAREQQRLSARVAALSLSEQASLAEKRAAEASTRAANAELELARFEQSRLVAKLTQVQLDNAQNEKNSAIELAILEKELEIQSGVVENRQKQIEALEENVTAELARSQTSAAEQVAQVVAVGPTIEIIEPPVLLTRGPAQIAAREDGVLDLVGRVTPADRLIRFAVNGLPQSVNSSGIFSFESEQVLESVELTAVDDTGERTSVSFSIAKRASTNATNAANTAGESSPIVEESYRDIDFGQYHAIIIGNNEYSELSDLRTAEADATMIDSLLREQYGFSTQLLINATKLDILTALNDVKERLTENDNLLVYYAGHGQIDPDGERGFWLPVDATVNDTSQWISNAVVTNFLDTIPAKQIMVVADSCFSGTLTQASIPRMEEAMPAKLRKQWLSLMSKRKVRTVLSSGGVKPVYDGTGEHSVFATSFIKQLTRNHGVLEGHRLYSDVRLGVQQLSDDLGIDQIPQYAAIKYAGHEVGEFLFVNQPAVIR